MSPLQYLRESGAFSTHLAIGSFAIGTLFLIGFECFKEQQSGFLIAGFFYVILAFLLNSIMFLSLLYHFFTQPHYREYLAVKMLIMMANIPIVILYIKIVFYGFNNVF